MNLEKVTNGDERPVYGGVLCAECGSPTSVGTLIRKGEGYVLRPVHRDCFEELQEIYGYDLSDEIAVELHGFIVGSEG